MSNERQPPLIIGWVERTDRALMNLLPLFKPLGTSAAIEPDNLQSLGWLSSACVRPIGSALILIEHDKLWDAEVVMRSAFEATLKFIYILADRSLFLDRLREYSDDLFEISRLKDHLRAEDVLKAAANPEAQEWKPISDLLLDPKEIEDIKSRFDRAARLRLENKWSFSALIADLASSGDTRWTDLGSLLHYYRNASHILHADFSGAAMIMERTQRNIERRASIHEAHAARLLGDMLSLTLMRLAVTYSFLRVELSSILDRTAEAEKLLQEFQESADAWASCEYERRE